MGVSSSVVTAKMMMPRNNIKEEIALIPLFCIIDNPTGNTSSIFLKDS